MRAEDAFPLKTSLLDRTDRGEVIYGGSANTRWSPSWRKPQVAPSRSAFEATPPSSCLRKDGDCKSGNLLVFAELHVEQTKRAVVGCISDYERRSSTRAPLLLGPGNAVALSIRGERLVVHSPPRLGVMRSLRYDRYVGVSPHPQDDLPHH